MMKHSATPAVTSVCAAVLLAVSGAASATEADVSYSGDWDQFTAYQITPNNGNVSISVDLKHELSYYNQQLAMINFANSNGAGSYTFGDMALNLVADYSKTTNVDGQTYRGILLDQANTTVDIKSLKADFNITLTAGDKMVYPNPTVLMASGSGTVVNIGDVSISTLVNVNDPQKFSIANNGIYATSGATVNLNGDVYINAILPDGVEEAYESGYGAGMSKNDAISGKYSGTVNVNQEGGHTVQLLGNLDAKKGTVNVKLDDADSYWHGHGTNLSSASSLTVSLANGAQWVPDLAVEVMQNLEVKDGGIVNLHGFNKHTGESGLTQQLEVESLSGTGGIFLMDLSAANKSGPIKDPTYVVSDDDWEGKDIQREIVEGQNDFLFVKSGSGSFQVMPVDTSKLAGVSRENPIWFADTASGVTFEGYGEKSTLEDGFVYDYTPVVDKDVKDSDANTNGTNWYIVGVETETTPTADTVISDASLNYAAATTFLELDSLNKRLGEIRSYGAGHTGVWVRAKAGRMSSNKSGSFRDTYQFYQLGADYAYRPADANGTFLFGGAIHTSKNDAALASGTGDLDTVGGSLYASWSDDSGWYADLIGKYSHLDDDYTVSSNGQSAKASYSNDAWSLSIEGGKRFENKGWVFEPQAQLVYTYIDGANYRLSNGVRVDQDSTDSIIGRAGFRLGHDFKFAEKLQNSKAYVKADLYHEFMGDRSVVVTGNDASLRRDVDGSDTWLSFGLGADFTITERLFAYADFEKSVAGDVKTKWQVNAGVRYAF